MSASVESILKAFAKGRASAAIIVLIGLVAFGAGLLLAPDLVSDAAQKRYQPFFGAAAGLVTGILIALVLEARHITSSVSLAVVSVFFVAASATAAVVALLPDLSNTVHKVAFATVVGGGLAALTSTIVLAGATLIESREDLARELAAALKDRGK